MGLWQEEEKVLLIFAKCHVFLSRRSAQKKDEIPHRKEISLSQIYDGDMQQLQTFMELHLMKIWWFVVY